MNKILQSQISVKSLHTILSQSWHLLARATNEPRDAFRSPVFGTQGPKGPALRTVILREVLIEERTLICHSDVRAEKIAHIQTNPNISWLFYHPVERIQLRLTGVAQVHINNEVAEEQWEALPGSSQRIYITQADPGTTMELDIPMSEFHTYADPFLDSGLGKDHFAVISTKIDSMDWLLLSHKGNQRAKFEWNDNALTANWIVP